MTTVSLLFVTPARARSIPVRTVPISSALCGTFNLSFEHEVEKAYHKIIGLRVRVRGQIQTVTRWQDHTFWARSICCVLGEDLGPRLVRCVGKVCYCYRQEDFSPTRRRVIGDAEDHRSAWQLAFT
jgi:hypothetical protein